MHSSTAARDGRRRPLGEEISQAFSNGNTKYVTIPNRNSSIDRGGNFDTQFQDTYCTSVNPNVNEKILKTLTSKDEKALQTQTLKSSSRQPRTYSKMIADYSQAMERTKSSPKKKEGKGLLSKLPFDSVVSSLSKLDGTKLKGKFGNTNNLSLVVNILLKDENQNLTDLKEKSEKIRKLPTVIKEAVKSKPLKVEEEKKEIARKEKETRKKEEKTEKDKSNLITVINSKNLKNDFNIVRKETEKDKENMPKWIKPKTIDVGPNSVNITVDNTTVNELKALGNKLEKVNILTAGDKIEVQIPIDMEGQITNDPNAKVSVLNLQIVAKNQDKQKKPQTPINPSITPNRRNYNTNAKNIPNLGKKSQQCFRSANQSRKNLSNKLSPRSHNLPWWAISEKSGLKPKPNLPPLELEDCMLDIFPSDPKIKVLASEEVAPQEDPPRNTEQPQERQRSTRRRKKLTGISRVTRHLESELQELRKSEAKSAIAERGKPSTSPPSSGISVKKEDKGENVKKSTKTENTETKECKKEVNKGPKTARAVHNKSKFAMYTCCTSMEKNVIEKVEVMKKPNIPVMQNAADIINRNRLKLDRKEWINTTFILKCTKKPEIVNEKPRINPLQPIEKRKDGTLIDYGLKVPTRKPRLRKPAPNKETTPKQTVSAPQQPKTTDIFQSKPLKIDVRSSILQTRSELPLTKMSKLPTRKPIIKEENSYDCGGPGKSDNEGSSVVTAIQSNNKGDVQSSCSGIARRIANRAVDFLKFLRSRQMPGTKTVESISNVNSEQPEKELIYSAWLNRFHTRKHPILVL